MKKIRGINFTLQKVKNSGVKHPDFDDSVMTSIVDFYKRFVADPDFKVNQLPVEFDLNESPFNRGTAADDALLEAIEPEYGQVDLEFMMNEKAASDQKAATKRSDAGVADEPTSGTGN